MMDINESYFVSNELNDSTAIPVGMGSEELESATSDPSKKRPLVHGLALAVALATTAPAVGAISTGTVPFEYADDVLGRGKLIFAQPSENSSIDEPVDDATHAEIKSLIQIAFRDAEHEWFEAGMESKFGHTIDGLVTRYGVYAVHALDELTNHASLNIETFTEALRVLGRRKDPDTKVPRFKLLIQSLNHSSPIVRDAAALGLADMEERGAIQYLEQAAKRERYASLKDDIEQIIEELRAD